MHTISVNSSEVHILLILPYLRIYGCGNNVLPFYHSKPFSIWLNFFKQLNQGVLVEVRRKLGISAGEDREK